MCSGQTHCTNALPQTLPVFVWAIMTAYKVAELGGHKNLSEEYLNKIGHLSFGRP